MSYATSTIEYNNEAITVCFDYSIERKTRELPESFTLEIKEVIDEFGKDLYAIYTGEELNEIELLIINNEYEWNKK